MLKQFASSRGFVRLLAVLIPVIVASAVLVTTKLDDHARRPSGPAHADEVSPAATSTFSAESLKVSAKSVPHQQARPTRSKKPSPSTSAPTPSPSQTSTPPPPAATSATPVAPAPVPTTSTAPPPATRLTAAPKAGVPAGLTLTPYTGPTTITTAGTVIDAKDIPVALTITAKNVTISRSRVHAAADSSWGIYIKGGSATITDTTVTHSLNGIIGDSYTATRVEVTALGADGFKLGSNVHVDHSWCHDLTPVSGAHADCGQMEGAEVNLSVTWSWFDGGDTSAIMLKPDFGPSSAGPVLIDNNVFGKGNYSLYCVPGPNGPYTVGNITISNNQFLRNARYGPAYVTMPASLRNNTWYDNGQPIPVTS